MENVGPWKERWLRETPWDQKGPHPFMVELLKLATDCGLPKAANVYEPGCGRAHNANALVARGYQVTAADFVSEAIAAAKTAYPDSKVTYKVEDALKVEDADEKQYDAIFDRAMLCALQPGNREQYVNACYQRLKPGGLFLGILFAQIDPSVAGPPFAVNTGELMDLFTEGFTLGAIETRDAVGLDFIKEEVLVIWRKKGTLA